MSEYTKQLHARAHLEYVHERYLKVVRRYNREYREERWTENRDLASRCEAAYDELYQALIDAGINGSEHGSWFEV